VVRTFAVTAIAGLALLAASSAAMASLPDGVALPGSDGILPGGNPSGGNWGACEAASAGSCDDNIWGDPTNSSAGFRGTDNAANVIVGGNFSAVLGSSESEGLLVVAGDSLFNNGTDGGGSYSIGVVGAGSFVTPADRADMFLGQGDVNASFGQIVTVGAESGGEERYGNIRVDAANRLFSDPSYGSGPSPYGEFGNVDSNADQSALGSTQNPLYDMETSFDQFEPLFGEGGLMNVYSQKCYAELAADAPGTAVNAAQRDLSVAAGTAAIDEAQTLTLTGDDASDIQTFNLDADYLTAGQVKFADIPTDAAIVINVEGSTVDITFASFVAPMDYAQRLLWNIPNAVDLNVGGSAQYPGSWLIGNPDSTATMFAPGFNGRVFTPGNLIHGDGNLGGSEFHDYAFVASLGCYAAVVPTTDPSPTPDPSVTPDPSPTPDPSVTPDPSPTPDPSVTPDPSPTPDPSVTPEPTPKNGGGEDGTGGVKNANDDGGTNDGSEDGAGGVLATTGADVQAPLSAALTLIALGTILVTLRRRRSM
jgi:choice-of-anchor A domain-containing protein